MENVVMLMYISRSNLSSVALEQKHRKSNIQIQPKDHLNPKQIEMGSQIRRQGQLQSALLFEAFPYFQCFNILANAAKFCKTLFD